MRQSVTHAWYPSDLCHSALLLLSQPPQSKAPAVPRFPLQAIQAGSEIALRVTSLTIVQPPVASVQTPEVNFSSVPHLDSQALSDLVTWLANLKSFTWKAHRQPPVMLSEALRDMDQLQEVNILLPSTSNAKWHASLLPSLPTTITTLCLGCLSPIGLTQLQQALPTLKVLHHLELVDSTAIDDATLSACGTESLSLELLVIKRMGGGGKLTDKGLQALLENAPALKALCLVDVEGRLSKSAWSKIKQVRSPVFQKLVLQYNEVPGHHHSWFFDHVSSGSLSHLFTLATLKEFRLERVVHPDIVHTPSLSHSKLAIDTHLEPAPLPLAIGQAILEHASLETICLDLFTITETQFQTLLDNKLEMRKLQVMVDMPMARLVACISIPPTGSLTELAISLSPGFQPTVSTITQLTQRDMSDLKGRKGSLYVEGADALAPATKDIKVC